MKHDSPYLLTFSILISSLLFTLLGLYWNQTHYHNEEPITPGRPTLVTAMQGIHDGLLTDLGKQMEMWMADSAGTSDVEASTSVTVPHVSHDYYEAILQKRGQDINEAINRYNQEKVRQAAAQTAQPLTFTTASEDYFSDAVFIGDSRTVGISEFAGIKNATFLCRTSLTVYDFDKPKITYENKKTSIKDVLSTHQFGKIYFMVGINECGTGTAQSFFKRYRDVIMDIRQLQPDALIFIEGNLLVTKEKSDQEQNITNENIQERNRLIATLANQKDIFYIDINDSTLCKDGALISDYTWDQVHIKAQYYSVWKEFLLDHAIIKERLS